MTFLRRPLLRIALAAIAVAALAFPSAALADLLGWSPSFVGPQNLPNPGFDPIPLASAFDGVSVVDGAGGSSFVFAVGRRQQDVLFPQRPGVTSGFFAYSTDGGAHWTSGQVGGVELTAVDALSPTDVWAVGENGTVAHWDGAAWTTRQLWTGSFVLRGVGFADASHGWAVGDGGAIAVYSNGTWSVASAPTASGLRLRALTALDATAALAVGDGGAIRRIGASGTAAAVASPTSSNLYGICMLPDKLHGWAVGDGPTVIRTADGGVTWKATGRLPMPAGVPDSVRSQYPAHGVAFADALTGVAVGAGQTVWRTLDGGDSWTTGAIADDHTLGDYDLRGVAFLPGDSSHLVVVAHSGTSVLMSGDDKARAYSGIWTGMTDPSASSDVAPLYGDFANVTVTASARPGNGGLASISYSIDGGAVVTVPVSGETTSLPLPRITGATSHTIAFWCADAAGHQSTHRSVAFTIMARPSAAGYPTTPVVTGTIRHNVSFSTYGYVSYHTAGTAPVTIYAYRYVSRRWVLYKAVTAKVSTVAVAGAPFSKYAATLKLPYAGTWRIRALHKVGTAARYSAYKTFTVR